MKTNLIQLLMVFAFGLISMNVQAQSKVDEDALKAFWKKVWQAYESGNDQKMFDFYADNASEITPDGNITNGKKAMIESWKEFMKMVDEKPKFTYENPTIRFISPDIAISTWDSSADIKIKGQQIGGKTKGMAVLHKIKGNWYIEFDSMTPVMQMHPN